MKMVFTTEHSQRVLACELVLGSSRNAYTKTTNLLIRYSLGAPVRSSDQPGQLSI